MSRITKIRKWYDHSRKPGLWGNSRFRENFPPDNPFRLYVDSVMEADIKHKIFLQFHNTLENMKTLLDDEAKVRTIARRSRLIKTASFPTLESFDDYDFTGVKFPKNFSREEMVSLDFIAKKHSIVFYAHFSCNVP